jgi:hypothetical protein
MVSRKRTRAAGFTTPRTPETPDNNIFVRTLPIIGVVPMLFYLPPGRDTGKLQKDIEKYGGKVVDTYEAYVYQLKIPKMKRKGAKTFFRGCVYSSEWIYDSIKEGKLIEEIDEYLEGMHKKSSLVTIPKGTRRQYTITEVLRIWEEVEKERIKGLPPMSFFHKLEALNLVPDRSASSLRTAWKKFSKMTKNKFVKGAMAKQSVRFSHTFAEAPEVEIPEEKTTKKRTYKRNLNNVFNSASTRPVEESSTPSEEPMQVDMDVMTKEPSIVDNCNEDFEFLLAVEDMQSALSHEGDMEHSYSMKPRKKRARNLDALFDNYEETRGVKRVKVTETEENPSAGTCILFYTL